MKPIDRAEILELAEYETVREHFRGRVIAAKKRRRVQLGPSASAVFENRDTVLLQIQEMLRTERITRPGAVLHEIETYGETLPADDEISCTVMIAIADKDQREAFLQTAVGFERHVWLVADGQRAEPRPIERGSATDRTTAVHYIKFRLPPTVAAAMRAKDTGHALELVVDHPAYSATAPLPPETVQELCEDLRS